MSRSAAALAAVPQIDDGPERFAHFFAQYHPRVRRYAGACFGYTYADEIAQETMARAYDAFSTFDMSRDPWPWLAVVARNLGRNMVRQLGRCELLDHESFPAIPAAGWADPVRSAEAHETEDLVAEAMSALPAGQRRVVTLRLVEGLGFGAIAELLGTSENAVRQQLFKGRKSFVARFEALGGRIEAALPLAVVGGLGRRLMSRLAGLRDAAPAAAAGVTAFAGALVLGAGLALMAVAPEQAQDMATATGSTSTTAATKAPAAAKAKPAGSARTTAPTGTDAASTGTTTVAVLHAPAGAHAEVSPGLFKNGRLTSVDMKLTGGPGTLHVDQEATRHPGFSPVCATGLVDCS